MASAAGASSSSMYRVGDYVFFESSAAGPYAIRRIEELNKTPTGGMAFEDPLLTCLLQETWRRG